MKKPNKTELAWAAGFFDGEGCTTVTRCKPKKRAIDQLRPQLGLRASLAQVELEPLKRFYKAVGIGAIRGPYKYGSNRQFHYQWNASNLDVLAALDALWPYLSNVKKVQAYLKVSEYCAYVSAYPPKRNQFDYAKKT